MAIVKVIEVLAQSEKSWEDAAQEAVNEASKTIGGIKQVYIKEMQAIVDDNRIIGYRLNAKISFVVSEKRQ
ncbi:MAG: dodecin family protein [Acidobacteriota bacterium]